MVHSSYGQLSSHQCINSLYVVPILYEVCLYQANTVNIFTVMEQLTLRTLRLMGPVFSLLHTLIGESFTASYR